MLGVPPTTFLGEPREPFPTLINLEQPDHPPRWPNIICNVFGREGV